MYQHKGPIPLKFATVQVPSRLLQGFAPNWNRFFRRGKLPKKIKFDVHKRIKSGTSFLWCDCNRKIS